MPEEPPPYQTAHHVPAPDHLDEKRITTPPPGASGATAVPPPAPDAQVQLPGRYDLHDEIGRGGMGVVLRGHDRELRRELAVKVLRADHQDKPDLVQRFIEEAQIGGQLQHPGVVPVYEMGRLPD